MSHFHLQNTQQQPEPPFHVLPDPFPQIGNGYSTSRVNRAIIFSVFMAIISSLTQGLYDVLWPNGRRRRIGGSGLLIAPSSSGKSAVLTPLIEPFRTFLSKRAKGDGALAEPAFFIEDVTRQALLLHLLEWPVAVLFTDEAGQIEELFRHGASSVVKCMDGDPIYHARVSTGRMELVGERLAMLLMMQPDIFESMKSSLSSGKGGVGLGNRLLWAQGYALPPDARLDLLRMSDDVSKRYTSLVEKLLTRTIDMVQHKKERPALRLSPDASRYLLGLGDELRQIQSYSAPWHKASEYVSRHAERTLSYAGSFHAVTQDDSNEISLQLVQAADQIGRWSIEQFIAITYEPPKLTQAQGDAQTLARALHQVVMATGRPNLVLSEVRRSAPNIGLTKTRFDQAVTRLGSEGKVMVIPNGRVDWLHVFAHLLPPFSY